MSGILSGFGQLVSGLSDMFDKLSEITSSAPSTPLPAPDPAGRAEVWTSTITVSSAPVVQTPAPTAKPAFATGWLDSDTYLSGKGYADAYNIKVNFVGDWTPSLSKAIVDAAEFYSRIIAGDLPGWQGIDDLEITARLGQIDGRGGVMGTGGFRQVSPESGLPVRGEMNFDSADVQRMVDYNVMDDLAVHEMMHVLGFGTLWDSKGLVKDYDGDLRFVGAQATSAYRLYTPDLAAQDALAHAGVPVETNGGQGTRGVHWHEQVFGQETMTGWLNNENHMSKMTVASLGDLGYILAPDAFDFI